MGKSTDQSRNEYLLDEYKIKDYCTQYNYKYKMHQGNRIAIIETCTDSWKITANETINRCGTGTDIEVGHYNKSGNKKGKMQFHTQKHARDIDYVFNSIISTHISGKNTLDCIFDIKSIFNDIKKLKHA